jgi:hypothetical protein
MSWEYGFIRSWSGQRGHTSVTIELPGHDSRLDGDASPSRLRTLLSELGEHGWELTAAESHHNVTVYWLKRPINPSAAARRPVSAATEDGRLINRGS